MGCDFIVGVNLAPHTDVYRRPHHILQLIIQLTGLMARKNLAASLQHVDVMIHPDIDQFSAFDFDNAARMIQVGYDTTQRMLERLHRVWHDKGGLRARLVRRLKRHTI
jgi:predicted acylesterase/phospholipase RssA